MVEINGTHKIVAKLFYSLISQLSSAERRGAILALSTLLPAVEDSYLKAHDSEHKPTADFHHLCADVLVGVSLSLKMAEDDGLIPKDLPSPSKAGLPKTLSEAEAAIKRTQSLLEAIIRTANSKLQ